MISPGRWGWLIAAGVLASSVEVSANPAESAATTRVECELDSKRRTVRGRVRTRFTNPSRQDLTEVYVWLLPNRLARKSTGLTDVNYYWVYPDHFDPGGMKLTGVSVGQGRAARALAGSAWRARPHALAGRGTLWTIELPTVVAPGEDVDVTMEYRGDIPERYDSLGCIDGACTLVGGFYPMVAAIDGSGWDLAAPPLTTAMEVSVELVEPAEVLLFDHHSGKPVRTVVASSAPVPYATLLVAPRWFASTRQIGNVAIRHLAVTRPPPAEDARGQILPYTLENYQRFALDVAAQGVELLADLGARAPPGTTLTVVEAPLRMRLAASHPGVILLSDRWYRIWPAERFRKFHRRELVRSLVANFFAARMRASGTERPADIEVAADMLGAYVMDIFTLRQYRKHEFAGDILRPVAFVPIIDQLLYAPQTMFSAAYFGAVVDDEPFRDEPHRFMHQRPRGRLYYEKLRDLLSSDGLDQAMRAMIDGRHHRAAAAAAYGAELDWFFRQWSSPYPRVNYRLVGSESTRLASGEFENRITVARDTAAGDRAPIEPVVVLAVLAGGEQRRLRWNGSGSQTTLSFVSAARLVRVVIDPHGRLVESKLPGREQHPRFDNRDNHRLRFVYQSFGVLLNLSDLSALLAADFTLSKVHDVKNRFRFLLFTSEDVKAGLTVGYRRRFGPTVDSDTLMRSVSIWAGIERLNSDFFSTNGDLERGATRFSLTVQNRNDDRLYFYEPMNARALAFGASLSVTRRDHGADDNGLLVTGDASARLTRVFTPRANHTVGLHLTAAAVVGDIETRSQLLRGGGNFAVRGFAPGALFGRVRLLSRTEYRHWFVHDMNWNFGHYNHLRGVGGALYFDVAALSPCDSYDLASGDSFYGALGYALRVPYDSFGTLPQLMRVDVAARVFGRGQSCLGAAAPAPPTLQVYVSFVPPF